MSSSAHAHTHARAHAQGWLERLNTAWHEPALRAFAVVVLAHWAEHLVQAYQYYVLGWPLKEARGVLGLWFPWLIKSEALHYGYALVMLAGLWILRTGFVGTSRAYWNAALAIQFWHHFEHALLQGQALAGENLFDSPVPISIVQLFVPRLELHLFYNTVVFIPMLIAMLHHLMPSSEDRAHMLCSCAVVPRLAA
jgi:hypothetical protein